MPGAQTQKKNGHFLHNPSPQVIAAVDALRTVKGDRQRAYAEAVHEDALAGFVNSRWLTRSRGYDCVYRLTGKPCPHRGYRYPGHVPGKDFPHDIPAGDHVSLWSRDGKPVVYVSQPYHLDLKSLSGIVSLCETYDWDLSISSWPSWHFPSAVITVEIWARQAATKAA